MKLSYAGAGVALILAATLAACGGKAQFTLQGTVDNLRNSGLVLANGNDTVSVPAGATSFTFPQQIDYGTTYNITVKTDPAHMNCQIGGGSGSAGHTVTIQAQVVCNQNTYTLGGLFTGLTAAADGTARTVTLLNGSTGGAVTISSASGTLGAGDFVFGTQVADGQSYGVTVVKPDVANGLTCTVANGTGVMHEAAVSNLILTCVPTP
ncbi:hypothetical protein [Duganella aceris]|uniref:Lipoprotein n=1 Tax=Duganella aceris TaxID=2703883 RepID=A0ABX0FQP1_9BURK|nr:hypothetical protein [Duganella aceris]NGZ86961.1 hypothetical protein [Duganella aceris]